MGVKPNLVDREQYLGSKEEGEALKKKVSEKLKFVLSN